MCSVKKLIKISPLKQGDLLQKQAAKKEGKRKSLLFKEKKKNIQWEGLFIYLFILLFELKEDKQYYQCPNTYKFTENGIHVSYWNVRFQL